MCLEVLVDRVERYQDRLSPLYGPRVTGIKWRRCYPRQMHGKDRLLNAEPRWPALIAALAVGGLAVALPSGLTLGPRWLFPTIICMLLVPTVVSHRWGHHQLDRLLGFAVTTAVTIELVASLVLLVGALPSGLESPTALLRSAASIWVSNTLVFALGIGDSMRGDRTAVMHGAATRRSIEAFTTLCSRSSKG